MPEEWRDLADAVLSSDDPHRVYESLAVRWAAGRGRAETDADLGAWMAGLAGITTGHRVLDPACGSGGLLVEAARLGAETTLGQDRDPEVLAIADARLTSRVGHSVTAVGDTLRAPHPALEAEPADAVLCDPPFRDREWGHEALAEDPRWGHGVPPRGEGELAWVQHCLSRVRPGGRVVAVVPASVSYRPGGRRIRAALLRSGAVDAVLEVPGEGGAESGRHAWVLARAAEGPGAGPGDGSPGRDGRVLMVGSVGHTESLRVYRDFFRAGRTMPQDGSAAVVVDAAELVDGEVDLRPSRHLAAAARQQQEQQRADLRYGPVLAELHASLELTRELVGTLDLAEGQAPSTTLGALADEGAVELHRAPMAMATDDGGLPVLTVQDLRDERQASGRCPRVPGLVTTEPGDVVVAETVREAPVRVVVRESAGAVLGPRLVLVRAVPERTDPGFLARLVVPSAVASGRTSSGRADLRRLRVPALSLAEQRECVRMWEGLEHQRDLTERIADLGARLAESGDRAMREGRVEPRKAEA